MTDSQTKQIKKHLDEGNSITAFEALQLYGCLRLASRMYDLRKSGYVFIKEMIDVGNGKRVAEYTQFEAYVQKREH
jgi:hypothetical protein